MAEAELNPEAVRVGATIRALRRAHGLTITELAQATGVSRSFLNNIELGIKSAPPPLCIKISDALGVPLAAITTRDPGAITAATS